MPTANWRRRTASPRNDMPSWAFYGRAKSRAFPLNLSSFSWSLTAKSPNITLSNANLTVQLTSAGGGTSNGRSEIGQSGVKRYFEVHVDSLAGSPVQIGLVDTAFVIGTDAMEASGHAIAYDSQGSVTVNGVQVATLETWAIGDVIETAVDLTNSLIWFRRNADNWNNDAAADPATGTNGISYAGFLTTNPVYAAYEMHGFFEIITANFGGSGFAFSPPSGFLAWNK